MQIRPITPADSPTVAAIAIESSLFPAEASDFLTTMMADYFAVNQAKGHQCALIYADEQALGVIYYQPVLAAEGLWNVLMLAVRQSEHSRGLGSHLMDYCEAQLRADGQRMVIVETSGAPSFARTRAFYQKCGYEAEARIRDYYATGEDMVVFRKLL